MVLKFRYDFSLYVQNLQKRIKKKKAKTEIVSFLHKWHFLSLQRERTHGQTLFSGSSRGMSSDKVTSEHLSHVELSDFLNARGRPAISLQ